MYLLPIVLRSDASLRPLLSLLPPAVRFLETFLAPLLTVQMQDHFWICLCRSAYLRRLSELRNGQSPSQETVEVAELQLESQVRLVAQAHRQLGAALDVPASRRRPSQYFQCTLSCLISAHP